MPAFGAQARAGIADLADLLTTPPARQPPRPTDVDEPTRTVLFHRTNPVDLLAIPPAPSAGRTNRGPIPPAIGTRSLSLSSRRIPIRRRDQRPPARARTQETCQRLIRQGRPSLLTPGADVENRRQPSILLGFARRGLALASIKEQAPATCIREEPSSGREGEGERTGQYGSPARTGSRNGDVAYIDILRPAGTPRGGPQPRVAGSTRSRPSRDTTGADSKQGRVGDEIPREAVSTSG
jgi:hypothetical protein